MMRKITTDRFELIRAIHPAARIETRDGVEVVVLREYDIASDIVREIIAGVLDRSEKPRIAPGDTLHAGRLDEFKIVDPDPATWFRPTKRTDDDREDS